MLENYTIRLSPEERTQIEKLGEVDDMRTAEELRGLLALAVLVRKAFPGARLSQVTQTVRDALASMRAEELQHA